MLSSGKQVKELLSRYRASDPTEAADVARIVELVDTADDPWSRSNAVHVTASALIVHPSTERVLLRWHARQRAWLQVGGHGEPGETEPLAVALREAREESGLTALCPWPDASLVHAVVVPVSSRGAEPAHEHADLRFVLATEHPDDARAERADAPLRWLSVPEAAEITTEANVRETLARVGRLVSAG